MTTQTELILFSSHPEFGRECVCCSIYMEVRGQSAENGSGGLAQVHQAGGGRAPLRTKTSHQPLISVLYQAILNQVTTKIKLSSRIINNVIEKDQTRKLRRKTLILTGTTVKRFRCGQQKLSLLPFPSGEEAARDIPRGPHTYNSEKNN